MGPGPSRGDTSKPNKKSSEPLCTDFILWILYTTVKYIHMTKAVDISSTYIYLDIGL